MTPLLGLDRAHQGGEEELITRVFYWWGSSRATYVAVVLTALYALPNVVRYAFPCENDISLIHVAFAREKQLDLALSGVF